MKNKIFVTLMCSAFTNISLSAATNNPLTHYPHDHNNNASTNTVGLILPYSDHRIGNNDETVVLNICGRPGAANIFGNFGPNGEPKIVVSPVYRLPKLIEFFANDNVKLTLDSFISKMQQVLQTEATAKNLTIEAMVASLKPEELSQINSKISAISTEMQQALIELGKEHGLEPLGIGGWTVTMKPSKIFPKGIMSPSFVYETNDAFMARFARAEKLIFDKNPNIVILQEVESGGEDAEKAFAELAKRHPDYTWVPPLTSITQNQEKLITDFTSVIGYKTNKFTHDSALSSRSEAIRQIFNKLFFKDDKNLDKTCVIALRDSSNPMQVKYVVNVHGDYNMANKDSRIYELLRRLFDTLPGLEFGADLNAQVSKTSEIQKQFTGFKGFFKIWPTPENGSGSNPTLDCLIKSDYNTEPADLDSKLSQILKEAINLNTELNTAKK